MYLINFFNKNNKSNVYQKEKYCYECGKKSLFVLIHPRCDDCYFH